MPPIEKFYTSLHRATSERESVHDAPTPTSIEFREFLKRRYTDSNDLGRALDVGCGATGIHTLSCARHGFRDVCGVDLNHESLRLARGIAADSPLTAGISHVNASALVLPFASESHDLVVLLGIIHHTPDPKEAVMEASRVLKEGGKVYIGVYCFEKSWFDWIIRVLRCFSFIVPFRLSQLCFSKIAVINDFFLDHMYVPNLWLFKGKDVATFIEQAGLTIEDQWPSTFDRFQGKRFFGKSITGDGLYRIFVCRKG